ncbi:hypothetical protein [Desulforamulus hydrothermalis]|uniref:Uncharacterized protein n=1 Tax=Desulforamulus hydrothermalis Lam5 = DSM 18033 TaxID=1121428 RepID=K8EAW1_9FIRM|nr:hypothetical protein [Desulforamulus hydrothermalis]CCO08788.1 conserved hypothetical protein [Desulforamulus hydrothermalis Lam5 = DSM 18033]SHG71531.1 hypothetical protein SAMN02745177_00100 [Desulforamulus hydrothermalis Lam5 = DSM 18033]
MSGSKKKAGPSKPQAAPGMRDFLAEKAGPEDIKRGQFTRVTTLSYDETH